MIVLDPQTLTTPGVESTAETWVYTDGTDVFLFPCPRAEAAMLVRHPPAAAAPPGVSLARELKSFARFFFSSRGPEKNVQGEHIRPPPTPGPFDV